MSYIENLLQGAEIEWKLLGDVAELKCGTSITKKTLIEGKYPVISGGQQPAYYIDIFNRDSENYYGCRFWCLCWFRNVLERTDFRK